MVECELGADDGKKDELDHRILGKSPGKIIRQALCRAMGERQRERRPALPRRGLA